MNRRTLLTFSLIFSLGAILVCRDDSVIAPDVVVQAAAVEEVSVEPIEAEPVVETSKPAIDILEFVEAPKEKLVTEEEIELLALLAVAEAEAECDEGKRLVIDTVLNRVDSPYFPDTIYEVVYQPNQFVSMTNGRSDRCIVTEDDIRLAREEVVTRTNSDVVFFQAYGYSRYGVPMFQVGNHYFSSYE